MERLKLSNIIAATMALEKRVVELMKPSVLPDGARKEVDPALAGVVHALAKQTADLAVYVSEMDCALRNLQAHLGPTVR